ncbi:lycopene beta-cyclase CrtY [Pseudomonas capeferrum]|uniref:lycopene beta-cyclase CrtY n=1 Tax=Pseudomonas capeferrum TaxID=1495066 RepID=UPI0015E3CA8F|nr:lycopene beta-cyclase CrtY [Pseudomonas capeferrum]MBA1204100.1 lycopene beta-cyclase CrtY [Pseudomonas capeferrum]
MAHDLILAGAGLANSLIAWRLRQVRPELDVICVDGRDSAASNHTWSFHDGDLDSAQRRWIEPLVTYRWPSYRVHFPQLSRTLHSGYASITGERFAEVMVPALGESLRLGHSIESLGPTQVRLEDGTVLEAKAVIDGRGARPSAHMVLGQQAFIGQVLRLERPHGLLAPVIMDARVDQGDGYRFAYVLPFSADTLLIEDTHYVDEHRASHEQLRDNIAVYARQQGWTIRDCLREEQGVLPITLAGDYNAFSVAFADQPTSGLRAGLFHCTTGYSLPEAVRLADWLARQSAFEAHLLAPALARYGQAHWQRQGFYRLLNRMLFLAGRPQDRWRVMQRFYTLPAPLIERFYAGQSHWQDRARILSGKPPVPVGQAIRAALRHSPRHFGTPS